MKSWFDGITTDDFGTVLYKLGKEMYVNNDGDTVIALADDEIRMFNKIIEEVEKRK